LRRILTWLIVVPLGMAGMAYAAAGTFLYVQQRNIIYQPTPEVIGAPPEGSIYRELPLAMPEGERLMVWAAPAAGPGTPTLVFFHGNSSNVRDFAETGEVFHAHGWGVVLAAYRGYAGNSGTPSQDGLFEDGRRILAALDAPGPVVLWGHSLGSGVAAQLASEGLADALILESPFTSLADIGAELYPAFPVGFLLTDRFDTAALVERIDVPVMILHSRDDPVVPFALGERLASAFGARATFVRLESLGHWPHQRDLSPEVAHWLAATGLAKGF
jgi:pimeloyl-ACP methyl ester carboxylesterase